MERERRQITLDAICAVTKVSLRHITALEAGRYEELPGGVFRRGILRSYLSVLGLEESSWLERFETSLREAGVTELEGDNWVEFAENVRRNRGKDEQSTAPRWMGVAMMVVTLVVLGWSVWKFILHGRLFS
jgi:cytoskeleton protein RodZ